MFIFFKAGSVRVADQESKSGTACFFGFHMHCAFVKVTFWFVKFILRRYIDCYIECVCLRTCACMCAMASM